MNDAVRILAVDDVEMNLDMLEIMLADFDFEIIKAGNGLQAMEALAAHPDIDTVLLDLEMPVMNGYQVLEAIKKNDEYRDIPVIVITASKDEVLKSLSGGANDFLSKPYNLEELKLRVRNHVKSKKLNDLTMDMNQILEKEVIKKTAELQQALALSREAEYEISLRLGKASEFRDLETGMHTRRISEFSRLLAKLAGLSEEDCAIIHHASPLHDVGKIGIPDRILLKPGKLDDSEFQIMKLHTVIGDKILSNSDRYPVISAGRVVALQHHEKWDGTGYPNQLSGKEIHVFARIVSIVDVFDALTSERPYKKAFTLEKTIEIMEEGRGTFFDPALLDLFLVNLQLFVKIKQELLDPVEQSDSLEIMT